MHSRLTRFGRRLRAAVGYRYGRAAKYLSIALENNLPAPGVQDQLVILDDRFPNLLTAFRVAEFNCYLRRFEKVRVYSTDPDFEYWIKEYGKLYPQFKDSIRAFDDRRILRGRLAYIVFLHNAFRFIDQIERAKLPFVFEFYPGGEFRLNDPESEARLQRVFSSPLFRKVIVTQQLIFDYVIEKGFCRPDQIEFVLGGVFLSDQIRDLLQPKQRFGVEKDVLDVCFVAFKQTPKGIDKGYDRFISTARLLAQRHRNVRFHVVGSFDESDVEIGSDLRDRIHFYGHQYTSFFPGFYAKMDVILSPNIPFVLAPGAFDGFPTGCCIEAALSGVAVFCTDELAMNDGAFKDCEEIVFITREPEEICAVVEEYVTRPDLLAQLANKGQQAFRKMFDLEKQMEPRLRLLSSFLENPERAE